MKLIRIAILVLSISVPATAQTVIANTDIGWLAHEGNETTDGAKNADPAKYRLTTPINTDGGGGGVLSFNASRVFGQINFGSNQLEMGMIRVEQASDVRGQTGNLKAEINFMLNDGSGQNDAAMTKPLAFTAHHITRLDESIAADLAARLAPYLPGGASAPVSDKLVSGRFELDLQAVDGNIVLYNQKCDGSYSAVWTMITGFIRRPPYVTNCP